MDFGHLNYGVNLNVPTEREVLRVGTSGGNQNEKIEAEAYNAVNAVNSCPR